MKLVWLTLGLGLGLSGVANALTDPEVCKRLKARCFIDQRACGTYAIRCSGVEHITGNTTAQVQ